jgi:hypothetical protein
MMGKGKSSWSIQHMNKKQKEGERFIYVTPYLDEVERVKKECGFEEPESSDSSKLTSFKKLLEKFYDLTDCPVLLNTSLNVNGRPIAGHHSDAVELFESSKIDYLIIGNKIIGR